MLINCQFLLGKTFLPVRVWDTFSNDISQTMIGLTLCSLRPILVHTNIDQAVSQPIYLVNYYNLIALAGQII